MVNIHFSLFSTLNLSIPEYFHLGRLSSLHIYLFFILHLKINQSLPYWEHSRFIVFSYFQIYEFCLGILVKRRYRYRTTNYPYYNGFDLPQWRHIKEAIKKHLFTFDPTYLTSYTHFFSDYHDFHKNWCSIHNVLTNIFVYNLWHFLLYQHILVDLKNFLFGTRL